MIDKHSVFRCLPHGLERRQVLFFDGIRHCAEIADIAHRRLRTTLTTMALQGASDAPDSALSQRERLIPAAFLDAWAVVDSIYRFRGLVKSYPHHREGPVELPGYKQMIENVCAVRNVADHLNSKIAQVEAHGGAALGTLTWLTFTGGKRFYMCAVYPGTPTRTKIGISRPRGGSIINGPTDFIELRAANHKVNLSRAMELFEQRIRKIEGELASQFQDAGVAHLGSGSDFFLQLTCEIPDGDGPPSHLPEEVPDHCGNSVAADEVVEGGTTGPAAQYPRGP